VNTTRLLGYLYRLERTVQAEGYDLEALGYSNEVQEQIDSLRESFTPQLTDYLYCETCGMVVDFWKYDHDLEAAGHDGCTTRPLTPAEYEQAVKSCEAAGCFDEE